jgi:hypothetical protein
MPADNKHVREGINGRGVASLREGVKTEEGWRM